MVALISHTLDISTQSDKQRSWETYLSQVSCDCQLCFQIDFQGAKICLGVHDDEEITRNKGPPVMSNDERLNLVKSCKY